MRFTGIVLWVQENKLSEKFYKKLGFDVVRSDEEHSVVKLNDFQITLVNMRDEQEFAKDAMAHERGRGIYIYLWVQDVDAEYKRQLKLGLKPATQPRNWPWGNREFVTHDADGYKIVFFSNIDRYKNINFKQ